MKLCPRCNARPKTKHCGFCRECKSAYDGARRKSLKVMDLERDSALDGLREENSVLRRELAELRARLAVSANTQ